MHMQLDVFYIAMSEMWIYALNDCFIINAKYRYENF